MFLWSPDGIILLAIKYAGILLLLGLMVAVGSILGENDYRNFLRKRIQEGGADPEDVLSGEVIEGQVVSSTIKEREY